MDWFFYSTFLIFMTLYIRVALTLFAQIHTHGGSIFNKQIHRCREQLYSETTRQDRVF